MSSLSRVKGANSRKEKLIKTVNLYINALTTKTIKSVSLSIVFKFLSNKYKANEHPLIKLPQLYKRKKISPYLTKWKNLIKDNCIINDERHINQREQDNIIKGLVNDSNRLSMNSFIEMFSTRMTNVKTFDNFYSRQKKYLSRQSLLKETMKLTQENEIKRKCTFSPDISLSQSHRRSKSTEKDTFKKLYEEDRTRRMNYNKQQTEILRNIKSESNITSSKGKENHQKIKKLYNDYKSKKNKMKLLMTRIDTEMGITFKPTIHHNPSYIRRSNQTSKQRSRISSKIFYNS